MQNFDIIGMEALIRWEHPEYDLIFPNLGTLKKNKLSPQLLEIEVTESCFIGDIDSARNVLEKLRAKACASRWTITVPVV